MQPDTSSDSPARRGADIRTFLFADVRGYTRYTREHGDEAASLLAAKLAEVVRAVVPEFHGDLFELRGDEAVSVFFSAREAIRAAVELQRRLREQRDGEWSFPLGVGMGIDSGEAVPTEGGFRGGALNLAARLCAIAKPGQILASDQTGHLAGRVEGVRLVDRRAVRLKGMEKPVRLVEVVPEVHLAPLPPVATVRPARWRPVNPRRMIVAGLVAVVVAGVLAGTGLFRGPASRSQLGLAANTLDAIEVGTNHVAAAVPVGGDPTGVAVGGGSVWVTSQADNHVRQVKLDGSGAVPFPVGSDPSGVAFGFGSAWVADSGQARISRITPKTGTVRHFPVGNGPLGVATGGQMVWVANSLDGTVMRIDPNDPARRKTFPVPGEPTAIAYGDGAVWVACGDRDTVAGIDPATGKLVHEFQDVGGPDAVAVGDGGVWVANTDGSVWRIDDNPNHQGYGNPNHVVPVGGEPTSLALTPGAVWVGNRITGMLTRIDPTTGTVVSRLRIGSDPAGIAATGGRVWVAADAAAHSHRGGTLRVAWSLLHPFDPIDPAIAYTGTAWQVLAMTNDGLLTFRRAAGAAGAQLVADLATRIPTPTGGGKTYTFQLRRGIRYSTGALVRPSDVRASIERLFTARSPNPGYYTGIVGADSCTAEHCDLHQGIAIDDAAGTVTFHLRAPDPDFLDKLALPFADVLPAGTPSHGDRHVPGPGHTRSPATTPSRASCSSETPTSGNGHATPNRTATPIGSRSRSASITPPPPASATPCTTFTRSSRDEPTGATAYPPA